jgi:hypothetical protein
MAPIMERGKVTSEKRASMTRMVPNGSAAVEVLMMATVFRKENTAKSGPGKTSEFRMVFQTQLRPPSWRVQRRCV